MPTIADAFQQAKAKWATEGRLLVEGEAREGLASGKYGLKNDTGNLMNRTLSVLLASRDGFKTGTNVEYGRAWELGFTRPSVTIFPKRAKALRFQIGGKTVFAKRATLPPKTFPARPWLKPAIDAMMPELQQMAERVYIGAVIQSLPDRTINI
jgi:hypothetical protein